MNRLRRAAGQARTTVEPAPRREEPGSWSVSECDRNALLGVFEALLLKEGFALYAYEFRSGRKGNGIIWAVPADAPALTPEDCPGLEEASPGPPKPPGAIPLMQAVEGGGSPWSYLSGSILSREVAEFGARWHGMVWTDQTILSRARGRPDAWSRSTCSTSEAMVPSANGPGTAPCPRHASPATPRREGPKGLCSTPGI